MNEHTPFLQWITHPVALLSIMLCGWMAVAFGKAYQKTHRRRYLWDCLVYMFFPAFFYSLYIFIGPISVYTSVSCSMGFMAGLLMRKKHEKRYFEYLNTRSILLFRNPDNVPLAPEIGVHPEKGLFVPHAMPSQQIYIKQGIFLLLGVAFIIAISVLYFR